MKYIRVYEEGDFVVHRNNLHHVLKIKNVIHQPNAISFQGREGITPTLFLYEVGCMVNKRKRFVSSELRPATPEQILEYKLIYE